MVDSNFLCSDYDGRADQVANEADSWERDHSCNTRNVTADGKYLGWVEPFDIDGSKEDALYSTLNKGNPKWECCRTIFYGVVSRDTVVVRSRGYFVSPRK